MTFNELKAKIEDWPNMFSDGKTNFIPVRDVLDLIDGAADPKEKERKGQRMKLTVEVKNVPDYVEEHRQGYIVARYFDGALWFYAFWQDKAKAEACADELEGSILIEKAEA